MSARHEVIVVGGGAVGAALALALKRGGCDVALVERGGAPRPYDPADYDLRVYAVSPGSAKFLAQLGVWPRIAARRISPYERMRVWYDDARQALSFEAAEARVAELGWIVENELLLEELWREFSELPIYLGAGVAACRDLGDAVALTLEDGRELQAPIVAGADGAESRLRALAGIEALGWDYAQQAIVCHVVTAKAHRRTALQRFLPSGPLAFLPLADGRSSIVWSTTEAAGLLKLPDGEFGTRLREAIQDELGEIGAITPRVSFPLRLLHAREYVKQRLVLLGDAAHVVHPLAGQGVNLGLADAQLLAQTLLELRAAGWPDPQRRLARYQRARKAQNLEMLALTDALNRAFGQAPLVGDTLQFGMHLLDRVAPLKTRLAQRALGLT